MRYVLVVSYAEGGDSWEESMDDPQVTCDQTATERGRALVDWFNGDLRPGEKPRAFISARVVGESFEHDWRKTSLITVSDRLGNYDRMKCEACGITGKRFGLNPRVKIDSQYRAAKYQKCGWQRA